MKANVVYDDDCIHGLPPKSCVLCLRGLRVQPRVGGKLAGFVSREATYDSRCPSCGELIEARQRIYKEEGSLEPWECRTCAETDSLLLHA